MAYIVFIENRPFSYADFLRFEVNGNEYSMTHGTFRNKISQMTKLGKVEVSYRSGSTFYSLSGFRFGKNKLMTPNRMGDAIVNSSDPIVRLIDSLPMQENSLHDIRLRFSVRDVWSIVSANSLYTIDPFSKDLCLQPYTIGDLNIAVTLHKTDTVSIIIGCSYRPVAVNVSGIIRLSNALTRVEERLSRLVEECFRINMIEGRRSNGVILPAIPEHLTWIVTMWHFSADSSKEYAGEKFLVTWQVAERALIRAYSKQMPLRTGKGTRIKSIVRLERQEYPGKSFDAAVTEKLEASGNNML